MENTDSRLARLDELSGYTIMSGDPDPRGWTVSATDGRDVGRVSDLIIDTTTMKASFLDVTVNRAEASSGNDAHLLVPTDSIEIGERERDRQQITLPPITDVIAPGSTAPARQPRAEHAQWPPAGERACTVRITRAGGHRG